MLGLLVVTHGRVAEELVASARTIVGDVEGLEAVSIDWNDDVDEATRRIGEARKRVDAGQGVLLLTDMFGGTPTNLALSLLEPGKLEIVTGVNLPMLIKFTNLRQERSLLETADAIAEEARQAVQVASRLLQRRGARPEGEEQ
jgi:PTS system mannose-specific IIA component